MNQNHDQSKPVGRRVRILLRCLLGGIFLGAGLLKVVHPADFHSNLLAYETRLPDDFLRLVALWLPWTEVVCGAALLTNIWTETAGFLVVVMSGGFVLLLSQGVLRGLDFDCGCFGTATPAWLDHPPIALIRTCALLVASLWLWLKTAALRSAESKNALGSP